MIRITKNTKDQVTFEKDERNETWFDNDCSNQNILKYCNRECDIIERIQFDDGKHIGSILHVYFKINNENTNVAMSNVSPIKITVVLKESCNRGFNRWECTINGEKREVTLQLVTWYCMTIDGAINSFKISEVKRFTIEGNFE